jgi:arginase
MPLAMLVGRGELEIARRVGLAAFPEERVILTDARDLDPGEREAVEGSAVTHLASVDDVPSHLPPDAPLWIHFDVDVVDPREMPAVAYPAPGGASAATVAQVFRHLAATGRVAAVSLSTWDPEMEGAEASREVAMGLLGELVA